MVGYLLYVVTHFTSNAREAACKKSGDAKEQCDGLLRTIQAVFFVVATLVLLIELCASLFLLTNRPPSHWISRRSTCSDAVHEPDQERKAQCESVAFVQ